MAVRRMRMLPENGARGGDIEMSIKLTFDESLFDYVEESLEMKVRGKTIGQCLDSAFKGKPALKKVVFHENGDLNYGIFIKVNEKFVYSDILTQAVKDADEIGIVYVASG